MPKSTPLQVVPIPEFTGKGKARHHNPYHAQGYRFYVTGPKELEGGKRWRRFFKTKVEAEAEYDALGVRLKNMGTEGAGVSMQFILGAVQCQKDLEPYQTDLRHAVDFFIRHQKEEAQRKDAKTVDVVAAEYLEQAGKRNLRPRSLEDLKSRVNRVSGYFAGKSIAIVTGADINAFLDQVGGSPRTRQNFKTKAAQLFNFARRQHYIKENPVADAEQIEQDDGGDIAILKPGELAHLLNVAAGYAEGAFVPFVAIAAFAGLRRSELEALSWSEVDLEQKHITVQAGKAKTRQRRLVDISDNLVEWLLTRRKKTGPIVTSENFRKEWDHVRTLAGWDIEEPEAGRKAKDIKRWPSNCLRHSCASYRVGREQDLGKVALQMGHDVNVLVRHYRGLVTPAAAAQYWDIRPNQKASVIPFAKAG